MLFITRSPDQAKMYEMLRAILIEYHDCYFDLCKKKKNFNNIFLYKGLKEEVFES